MSTYHYTAMTLLITVEKLRKNSRIWNVTPQARTTSHMAPSENDFPQVIHPEIALSQAHLIIEFFHDNKIHDGNCIMAKDYVSS